MKQQTGPNSASSHDKFKTMKLFIDFFLFSKVESKFKKMCENTFMQFIYGTYSIFFYHYLLFVKI
jgi:hypothetical protein